MKRKSKLSKLLNDWGLSKRCGEDRNILDASWFARLVHRVSGVEIYDYKLKPNEEVKASVSRIGILCAVLHLSQYFWSAICTINHQNRLKTLDFKNLFIYYSKYVQIVTPSIAVLYITTVYSRNQSQLAFWQEITKVEHALLKFGENMNYKRIRHLSYIITALILCAILSYFSAFSATFLLMGYEVHFCNLYQRCLSLHFIFASMIKSQFWAYVMLQQYRSLNRILGSIRSNDHLCGGGIFKTRDQESRSKKTSLVPHTISTVDTIKTISKIFSRLHAMRSEMNRQFGTVLLLVIIDIFTNTIIMLYNVMEVAVGGFQHRLETYLSLVAFVFDFIMFRFGTICALVSVWEKIYSENHDTTRILNRFILQNGDEGVKKIATRLSLQILHQKHKLSVHGLFDIDSGFLVTTCSVQIAGTVATYLTVLVQFAVS